MLRRGSAALAAVLLAACASSPKLRPYTSDGCSLFPDGTSQAKDAWLHCCEAHDRRYWIGGTEEDRMSADLDLRSCVAATGRPELADWMLKGTRIGGGPYVPAGFRWGYGWSYLRGYKPLNEDERKQIAESAKP
jgi:hypothetical protein